MNHYKNVKEKVGIVLVLFGMSGLYGSTVWDYHQALAGVMVANSTLEGRVLALEFNQREWAPFLRQRVREDHRRRIEEQEKRLTQLEKQCQLLQENVRHQQQVVELIGREQRHLEEDMLEAMERLVAQTEDTFQQELRSLDAQLRKLKAGYRSLRSERK
jgi:TolA-binding protein